jgi:hypothetical protein
MRFDFELILLTGLSLGLTYHESAGWFYVTLDLVIFRIVIAWGPEGQPD